MAVAHESSSSQVVESKHKQLRHVSIPSQAEVEAACSYQGVAYLFQALWLVHKRTPQGAIPAACANLLANFLVPT